MMSVNWLGIICVVIAVIAFAVTYQKVKPLALKLRFLWLVGALLCSLPGLSFSFYYTHLLPETAAYYQFRSLPLVELCLIPIGIAGGVCATFLPRVLLIVPLLGTALVCVVPFLKPIVVPLRVDLSEERWEDGLCMQSTGATCGPASLATILHSLGITESGEAQLAWQSYTYSGGTEAWYLARSARRHGVSVRFRKETVGKRILQDLRTPAIVGVKIGAIGHFVTVLDRKDEQYLVGDPFRTKKWMSADDLDIWYTEITGFAMEIGVKE